MSTKLTKGAILTAAGYPRIYSPRLRYRRPHHLQDSVLLQIPVPAAMIPWLEKGAEFYGPGVERTAVSLLTSAVMDWQERYFKGNPDEFKRIADQARAYTRLPCNCGPTAKTQAFIEEMHGEAGRAALQDGKPSS